MVRFRSKFYAFPRWTSIDCDVSQGKSLPSQDNQGIAHVGELIRVVLLNDLDATRVGRNFVTSTTKEMNGCISVIFEVGHKRSVEQDSMPHESSAAEEGCRSLILRSSLNSMDYQFPSRVRMRDIKDLFQPGDIVAILRPPNAEADGGEKICIVFRLLAGPG